MNQEELDLFVRIQEDGAAVLEDISNSMGRIRTAAGLVGIAADAALVGSTVAAAGFQQQLTYVANNTNMTTDAVETLRQTVLSLGRDGQSLTSLSIGFEHAYNMTQNAQASAAELTVANEAAIATGSDAAAMTNTLATAMHEYGTDISNAGTAQGQYNDILANANHTMGVMHLAATQANTDLSNWSEQTARATATAANLNVPLDQVSAALATLTKHGFPDLANAQTQVVSMFTHMVKPSKEAETELKRLSHLTGVDLVGDFSAAGLSSKGLTGVLGDLKTAYAALGLSNADATGETMKLLNAQRGGLGTAALLGTGYADYNTILASLNDQQKVNTITQDQFNRTMQNASQEWKAVKNDLREIGITIGTVVLPPLAHFLHSVMDATNAAQHFAAGHAGLIATLLALVGAFGTVIGGARVLSNTFLIFERVIGPLRIGLLNMGLDIGALIPWIGAAIAVGALLYEAWQHDFGGIQEKVRNAADGVRDGITQIRHFIHLAREDLDSIGHVSSGAQLGWTGWASALIPLLSTLINWFGLARDGFTTFKEALSGNWVDNNKIAPLHRALGELGLVFHDVGLALHDFATIGHVTSGTLLAFPPSVRPIVQVLSELGAWLTSVGLPALERFGAWLVGVGVPAVIAFGTQAVHWFTANILPALLSFGTTALSGLMRFSAWLVGVGLPAIIAFGTQAARWFASSILPALLAFGGTALSGLMRFGGWLTGVGLPAVSAFGSQAAHWLSGTVLPALLAFGGTALAGLLRFGAWLTGTALPALAAFGQSAQHWITNGVLPGLIQFGQILVTALTPAWNNFVNGLKQAWDILGPQLMPILTQVVATVALWVPYLEAVGGLLLALGQAALPYVIAALQQIGGFLAQQVSFLWPGLRDILEVVAAFIGAVVIVNLNLLALLFRTLLPTAMDLTVGAIHVVLDVIKLAMDLVTGLVHVATDLLHGDWAQAWSDAKTTVVTAIGDIKALFADAGTWLLQAGKDFVTGFINGIEQMIPGLLSKVSGMATSAISRIKSFGHSPWPATIQNGIDFVQGFINGIGDATPAAMKAAAEAASATLSAFKNALDLSKAMQSFTSSGGKLPSTDLIQQLAQTTQTMIQSLGDSAAQMSTDFLTQAKAYADASNAGWGVLSTALKFAADLAADLANGALTLPPDQLISDLKFKTEHMVQSLGDSAATMSSDFIASAKAYSDAATAGWGVLAAALKFAADYAGDLGSSGVILPPADLLNRIQSSTAQLVGQIGASAALMGGDFLTQVKNYSDAATAAWGVLGAALKFLSDVSTAETNEVDLSGAGIAALMARLTDLATSATRALVTVAPQFATVATSAKNAGDAMKAAFDPLDAALAFLSALTTAENNNVDLSGAGVGALVLRLINLATTAGRDLALVAPQFKGVATESKTAGDAMKAAFDPLDAALTFLTDLAKFQQGGGTSGAPKVTVPPLGAISTDLVHKLTTLAAQITQAFLDTSQLFKGPALQAARQFAQTVKPVFDAIKPVMDDFTALQKMGVLTDNQIALFKANIVKALNVLTDLPAACATPLAQVQAFVKLAQQIAAALQAGVDILKPWNIDVSVNGVKVPIAGGGAGGGVHSAPLGGAGGGETSHTTTVTVNMDSTQVAKKVDKRATRNKRARVAFNASRV